MKTLGNKIEKLRLKKCLNQQGLADLVGVKQPTINRIESGLIKNPKNLNKIAEALGTTDDYSNKWAEAIGQSLHYSIMTNKKAGIVLICRDACYKHYKNVERINTECGLGIDVKILK
jgi:transcriptional regulator with XRE-family HTH domain